MCLSSRNRRHKRSWKERRWHAVSARGQRYCADFVLFGYGFTRWENRARRSLLLCLTALICVTKADLWTASFLQHWGCKAGKKMCVICEFCLPCPSRMPSCSPPCAGVTGLDSPQVLWECLYYKIPSCDIPYEMTQAPPDPIFSDNFRRKKKKKGFCIC